MLAMHAPAAANTYCTLAHRSVETTNHDLVMELRKQEQECKRLQARYEARVQARGGEEEEEENSNAYYMIKAAQQREELQRRGDELDAQIKDAEQNIRGLQYALEDLNGRNAALRDSLQRASQDSNEMMKLQDIDQQAKYAKATLHDRQREKRQVDAEYEEEQQRLSNVQHQLQVVHGEIERLSGEKQQTEETLLTAQVSARGIS